jgi:hypothetical protein
MSGRLDASASRAGFLAKGAYTCGHAAMHPRLLRVVQLDFNRNGWRLIQEQPIKAELQNGFTELLKIDGLTNVAIRSEAIALESIFVLI